MKRLNSPKNASDLAEIESGYMAEYDGGFVEGYSESGGQGEEKQLLREVLATLRKHWFLILCFNLFITSATIVYVAQKQDYYIATARIQVNSENNPASGITLDGGSPVIVNNPGNDPVYFTTQLQILEGAGLLRHVAQKLDLENNQTFLDPRSGRRLTVWQNVKRMFGLYQMPAAEQTISNSPVPKENKLALNREKINDPDEEIKKYAPIVGRIKGNLTVLPVKDTRTSFRETRLIEIEYTHGDPNIAAKVVNAIGDAYVMQNLELKINSNASAGDFFQKRVAELQSDIRLGEERLINYSKNNQIVSLDAGQNTVVQRFGDLNLKLGEAENARINALTAYQAAMQNQMRTVTAETKDPQVTGLESRLTELKQKLAQLKTEYTDEWYEVVQTRKQIEGTENQLLLLRKRASDIQLAGLEERLNEATAREKELRTNFEQTRSDVIKQNEASINYRIIQQEINTNKLLLDGLLQRSRENDIILNGMPNNVLVAERAEVPNSPAGPERMRNVFLAFIVSLLAGCGLAFLIDWLNDSIHNSDDIENNLGLPLLGAIPVVPPSLGERLMPKSLTAIRRKKSSKNNYNLAVYERPEFVEAYLHLRTSLMLSTAGGAPQNILVTSGEEGEGKTITALNLAESLAATGARILLIDADLRYPRVHLVKEINNDFGLTTLLTAGEINEQLIEETIHKNNFSNLHVLTAGERSVNPANLLCSEEMRSLLATLSKNYSHIVIDSPPVLYFADSTILSTLVDAVVLVVRDGVSSKQLVIKAKKALQNVGANVVGMVMNGINLPRSSYSRYKYYNSEEEMPSENGYQTLKIN